MENLKPRGGSLRYGRVSENGRIYLVTCVTHQRQKFFSNWNHGRLLVKVLIKESSRAETLSYVVMPDHLHWLMQLQTDVSIPSIMRTVKSVSSRFINRALDRTGKVWQSGYYDHALRSEEDLVSTARYVVANPLRARLVGKIGDYPLWDAVWL